MRHKTLTARMIAFIGIIATPMISIAQLKHSPQTNYPEYTGLVMAGYQGWFRAAGDGSSSKRFAYGDEKRSGIDMWPDVSEYSKTYETSWKHADGKPARFFSSLDKSSVDLHFKWMRDYKLDGVFMQRFFNNAKRHDTESSAILRNALQAASENNRAIGIMYDLSGLSGKNEDCTAIIEDWKFMVDSLKATNQDGVKTYIHHKGKPLVTIWGIGFPDRPYNIRSIGLERLIDFLKNDPVYGGCSVMLGVPAFWRTLNADCISDPYLHDIIKSADIVMPWNVQRYTPLLHNDMDRFRDNLIADQEWCKANNLSYVPCITPGFSWHNLSKYEFPDDVKPVASIPRQGGRFYWQQIYTALNAGAKMLYVAMFDEVNEATAIFKTTDNPPVSKATSFITNDGKPSDHYLFLTGEAAMMLKKQKPLT
ncbi:MAG: glycoside hydrolase family 71/99-like protein, partial [Flavitalea sp.]